MTRLPDFGDVIKRFPVAAIIMGCVTAYLIFTGIERLGRSEGSALIGGALSAYFAMMQTLWAEAREKKPNWIIQIIVAIAMVALFYNAKKLQLNIFMLIGVVLLILGNSVRFGRARDDLHIWDFTHKIWTAAGFAFAGSLIYFLGVMAIMAALKSLFGINIEQLVEHLIMPIGLAFLAPLYWLSNIPEVDEPYAYLNENPSFVSKAVAFLGTWILSPLTLIYAFILLTYALKILLQRELPDGEIDGLTTPFLLIGTLTWLLLEPPFIQKNKLARLFRKFWFVLSVPAAIMLFISVAVRVREYGLTLERILLILACFWSLGLAVWFSLAPKSKRDIRLIPALAACLFLVAAPTSQILSNGSQAARFEKNLRLAGILQDDGTVRPDALTDRKAAAKAKGALKYLTRHEGRKNIEKVLQNSDIIIKPNHDRYTQSAALEEQLGLKHITLPSRFNRHISQKDEYRRSIQSINVKGFDKISQRFRIGHNFIRTPVFEDGYTVKFKNGELRITTDTDEVYTYDFQTLIENLESKEFDLLLTDPYVTIVENDRHKIVLVIDHINRWDVKEAVHYNAQIYMLTSGFTKD